MLVTMPQARDPKVVGSNPTPATKNTKGTNLYMCPFIFIGTYNFASDFGIPTHLGVLVVFLGIYSRFVCHSKR